MTEPTRSEPTLVLPDDDGPGEDLRDEARESREPRSQRKGWLLALIAAIAIAAVIAILLQREPPPQVVEAPAVAPPPAPRVEDTAPPPPRYPVEPATVPLPPLDASDATVLSALQALFAGDLAPFLQPRDLVRNIVVTVDNLPRRTLPVQRLPLKPPPSPFGVNVSDGGMTIGGANALRYRPYIGLMQGVESANLVALYMSNYPLFQQAYRELGYPNGHFNDRLVEAIDVMLAAPEDEGPLRIVQPKVFYEFADRDLEGLPAGQKLMLRIGADNAKAVKAKLTEIRQLLTAQSNQPPLAKPPG